jgi:hypothetical protein
MAWEIYGIRGIYLVFEPSDGRDGDKGKSIPTTDTEPVSFKASDFENGCYRITLRIDTNTNSARGLRPKVLLRYWIAKPRRAFRIWLLISSEGPTKSARPFAL